MNWSAFGLQKEWNRCKAVVAPWWAENSKHAYQSGCVNLARALSNWSKARNGTRAGTMGFPGFKSLHRTTPTCSFSDGVRLSADRRHVVLPVLGSIRLHHSTAKRARRTTSPQVWLNAMTSSVSRRSRSPRCCRKHPGGGL